MPQKPLNKPGKKIEKKQAANRHGKTSTTKKGQFQKPPKKKSLLQTFKENKELSKTINQQNEANAASKATQTGGRLTMVRAPPPVLAPADKKKKTKAAAAAADEMETL